MHPELFPDQPQHVSSRRQFLKAVLGVGIAGAALVYQSSEIKSVLKTPFSFDFDIDFNVNRQMISGHVWQGIQAKADAYHSTNDKEFFSMMHEISVIDREKAKDIPLLESDWKSEKDRLDRLAKNGLFDLYTSQAHSMFVVFPDRQQELRASLDDNFENAVSSFHSLRDSGSEHIVPVQALELLHLYPGKEKDMGIDDTRERIKKLLDTLIARRDWSKVGLIFSGAKHVYNDVLPHAVLSSMNDDMYVKDGVEGNLIYKLDVLRETEDWLMFSYYAAEARLLEAKTVRMTPDGLLVQ